MGETADEAQLTPIMLLVISSMTCRHLRDSRHNLFMFEGIQILCAPDMYLLELMNLPLLIASSPLILSSWM